MKVGEELLLTKKGTSWKGDSMGNSGDKYN
jgi:hypothetical protein